MALKLYNTLTRQIDEFKSIKKGRVLMYYCGPTVYWTQHIGNLRGAMCVDLIVRTLGYLGYKVKLVRNYTDVGHLVSDEDEGEDKMEKGAKREGLSPAAVAQKYIKVYESDTRALNILEPDAKPLATKYIKEMQTMVKILLEKGYAYTTPLAIYFNTTKAKNYSQLSGQGVDEKKEGAGKGEVEDSEKKHSADFALWFFRAGKHKNAIQYWPSPFISPLVKKGEGFPGWHIECSAMSKKLLGNTIDIHMGGIEHVPVHHTNEIAQSEATNGVKFVNYWLHNGHLLVDNRKMAKSEGTGYSLGEVIDKGFSPLALRYFFLQAHYRSKQNFTWEAMTAAENGLRNFYHSFLALGSKTGKVNNDYQNKFKEKISDDFNIPQALAVTQQLLADSKVSSADRRATLLDFEKVLGLNLMKVKGVEVETATFRLKDRPVNFIVTRGSVPDKIKEMAEERLRLREQKKYQEADKLRGKIGEAGFLVEDTKTGCEIKKK